ncbi:MAG: hypothetical protein AAGI46_07610 [Planctomycetota bacterium]
MPRLVLAILGMLLIGATLLLLRQQHLRVRAETHRLHAELYELEQKLWRQQVQVAAATSPAALERTMERLKSIDATTVDLAGEWAVLTPAVGGWDVLE